MGACLGPEASQAAAPGAVLKAGVLRGALAPGEALASREARERPADAEPARAPDEPPAPDVLPERARRGALGPDGVRGRPPDEAQAPDGARGWALHAPSEQAPDAALPRPLADRGTRQ